MDTAPDNPDTAALDPDNTKPQQQSEPQPQQPQDDPPASPPLPQKHTPATPGPRATRFIEMYHGALRRTLSRVSYDNFATCFPTIATYAPNALRNVQNQMVDYLEDRCIKEFEAILEERDVIRKLNELETLNAEAEARRHEAPADAPEPIPPHTLPPETILRAHLHPYLAHHHARLSAALANTKLENEALFAGIQAQRAEIDSILAALDRAVADVDGANALLAEVGAEIAAESRTADAEMTGG
ncbi:Nnf1-domain-containing protein [Sodiomyces alkalinus F11]|uniref:Nnf1-domain-containing protein n=1 Tax=Sodiomyces alkalinus (strain CBS 110278 / VKM F-3762 / F11) TaxID=1314773 RepID=A0A3N2PVK5_SODAK|nr:Nnf1-domain-containing protein [Sodiomyces alkalinus F11]ROT38531.1 Nnf1-domain-containing protein [Sodiomyces alkalinus F11]